MANEINEILKTVLKKINPSDEEIKSINKFLKEFTEKLKSKIKELNIEAEIFVGGSFAKKTLMKKGRYDIDLFVRFNENYKDKDISKILGRVIKGIKVGKISVIHGSRDYFKVEPRGENFFIELIPVLKVKDARKAVNITDLSYFHVNYIRKKLNTEKLLSDTRLAKAFCHATNCYGAESYINGFSGYALELLVCRYKSFLNFIKAIVKIKDKEIIDIERLYKNKYDLQINMNSAKMNSPIILIDPTYKERNALAALSKETFVKFQDSCKKFLKKPTKDMFEIKKVDFEKIKSKSKENKSECIILDIVTDKQEGDIAGSKLRKFYRHLSTELQKFYLIKQEEFEYDDMQSARCFFEVKKKNEIIFAGPEIKDSKENIRRFKQRHKEIFEKKGRIYAREKINKSFREFLKDWMNSNSKKIQEMYIREIKIEA